MAIACQLRRIRWRLTAVLGLVARHPSQRITVIFSSSRAKMMFAFEAMFSMIQPMRACQEICGRTKLSRRRLAQASRRMWLGLSRVTWFLIGGPTPLMPTNRTTFTMALWLIPAVVTAWKQAALVQSGERTGGKHASPQFVEATIAHLGIRSIAERSGAGFLGGSLGIRSTALGAAGAGGWTPGIGR